MGIRYLLKNKISIFDKTEYKRIRRYGVFMARLYVIIRISDKTIYSYFMFVNLHIFFDLNCMERRKCIKVSEHVTVPFKHVFYPSRQTVCLRIIILHS